MSDSRWWFEACVVGAGTACGAVLRWLAGVAGSSVIHTHPVTMVVVVNLVGSLCLGFVTGRDSSPRPRSALFWRKGVLAGFTTYSGIHIASAGLVGSGGFVFIHVMAGVCMAALGFALGRGVQR